eukprot:3159161-Amphidinium_carterae.1
MFRAMFLDVHFRQSVGSGGYLCSLQADGKHIVNCLHRLAKLRRLARVGGDRPCFIPRFRNPLAGLKTVVGLCKACPTLRVLKLFGNQLDDSAAKDNLGLKCILSLCRLIALIWLAVLRDSQQV